MNVFVWNLNEALFFLEQLQILHAFLFLLLFIQNLYIYLHPFNNIFGEVLTLPITIPSLKCHVQFKYNLRYLCSLFKTVRRIHFLTCTA